MLVYEFVFNGTLHDYIHNNSKQTISLNTRIRIAAESAEAVAYLHSSASPPILHRDVKSSNILINENYIAKVSDFGAFIIVTNDEVQLAMVVQGTYGYLDTEYIRTYVFTEKSMLSERYDSSTLVDATKFYSIDNQRSLNVEDAR